MTQVKCRAAIAARLPFDDSPQYLCRSQKMRLPWPEVPSFPVIFSIMTINGICNLQFNYHQNFWTRSQAQTILSKLVDILAVEGAELPGEEVERTYDFQPLDR